MIWIKDILSYSGLLFNI